MNPLPANLPPLPEGYVYLGKDGEFNTLPDEEEFAGLCLCEKDRVWTLGEWEGTGGYYAALADSEIVSRNKPTTVLGWLETMPEPWRGQAIASLYPGRGDKVVSSMKNAMNEMFWWSTTPEGKDYWFAVSNHYLCGTDLPSPTTAANYVAPVERPLVSLEKEYTSDGEPFRLLCDDGPTEYSVIGMGKVSGTLRGFTKYGESATFGHDLVEVRPEPREFTLYVDPDGVISGSNFVTARRIRVREVTD